MAHPDQTQDYTSGSGADTTTFTAANPARQITPYGAGSIVMYDNAATPAQHTYTVTGGERIVGEWSSFVSTTCSRIRATSVADPVMAPPLTSATVVPGNYVQSYLNGGATLTAAFTAAIGTFYAFNPSGATFAYTLPAITANNDGQKIGVVNVSTGSTATVAAPTGSDNVGNSAGTTTGATAAGPLGGLTKVYTADNTRKAWITGL